MTDEVIEQAQEPQQINTHGRWVKYSEYQPLEIGKSYRVTVNGDCLMALSKVEPTVGIKTNQMEFTASEYSLWIKTL